MSPFAWLEQTSLAVSAIRSWTSVQCGVMAERWRWRPFVSGCLRSSGVEPWPTWVRPSDKAWVVGPGDDAAVIPKIMAASGLILWFGVVFWGTMLPFLRF
jgi:hypothetical protein